MALQNTAFTPTDGFRNASAYPTNPGSETNVRDQFQDGLDQIRDEVNTKIVAVLNSATDGASGADNVAATSISGLTGATVQSILESLKTQIDGKVSAADTYNRTQLNDTTGVTGSNVIGTPMISGVSGTTVKDQLRSLKTIIDGIVLGSIPDGSLGEAKMANDMKKDIAGGVAAYNTFTVYEEYLCFMDIRGIRRLV